MTRRAWLILLLAGMLILWLAACSSNDGTPAPADDTEAVETTAPADETEADTTAPVSEVATASEAPAAEPAAETEEPAPEVEATEPATQPVTPVESVEVEEPATRPERAFAGASTAFEELTSYRYQTLFTFVGEEDGEIEAGSIELTGTVAGPDQQHLVWHDLDEDEQFEVIRVGSRAWILEDGMWTEVPPMVADAMTNAILVFAPSIAWSGIFGELEPTATYVGEDTVNGVTAHHYASTYQQWGGYWAGELQGACGDVWVADEGYPVKYEFSATGIDEDGDRGTVTWRMDLTDVNADITITPPVVER